MLKWLPLSQDERTVGDEPVGQSADGGIMERPLTTVASVCSAVRWKPQALLTTLFSEALCVIKVLSTKEQTVSIPL